jgi:probable F420-dependent oxidoreductase
MKEMIEAIRAIWDCWLQGNPLQFRGEFYQHTLMTPFFSPDASDVAAFGVPKIFLAGVGERMTEAAGEVCDGFLCHSFTTESYLREVTIPSLARGRERAGKTMDGFEIRGPGFVVTGDSEEDMQAATTAVRGQIAFYASTPAYRGVLDHHGWGELQSELNAMSKRGEWSDMGSLITDDILNAFAVVAPPDEVARELGRRFADVSNRIALYAPYKRENSWWMPIVKELESL